MRPALYQLLERLQALAPPVLDQTADRRVTLGCALLAQQLIEQVIARRQSVERKDQVPHRRQHGVLDVDGAQQPPGRKVRPNLRDLCLRGPVSVNVTGRIGVVAGRLTCCYHSETLLPQSARRG